MPTISAIETTSQIQNSDVATAASAAAPSRVPTQNASADENTIIRRFDATAGAPMRQITRDNGSATTPDTAREPITATGTPPS